MPPGPASGILPSFSYLMQLSGGEGNDVLLAIQSDYVVGRGHDTVIHLTDKTWLESDPAQHFLDTSSGIEKFERMFVPKAADITTD
jgi:hypothetical protein